MSLSRFLTESLGLLSSYWSDGGELAPYEVSLADEADGDVRSEVEVRFALACCRVLLPIIARIERVASATPRLYRDRDVVAAPVLDVPRHVQERAARLREPDYPILRLGADHAVPENMMVRATLLYLSRRLQRGRPRRNSIEAKAVRRDLVAVRRRLNAHPWVGIPSGSLDVVVIATVRRLNRGQVASPTAYRELVEALNRMRIVAALPGDDSQLIEALVDFPGEPAFADRVFEVWCLLQLGQSLVRLGGRNLLEPTLARPRSHPAMAFEVGGRTVELFFQRSLPADQLRYTYENGIALRGQPDTTLVRDDGRMLLFDAKNRVAMRDTRPEETFKVLGYFESLALSVEGDAMLVFVGDSLRRTISSDRRTVELLAVSAEVERAGEFQYELDAALRAWIDFGRH